MGQRRRTRRAKVPHRRRLGFEPLEDRRLLAVAVVDTHLDVVDEGDGLTSLREAILAANTLEGPDTIEFDPAMFASGPVTILLTMGELEITDTLTINCPGADLLTIDASGNDPTPDVKNGDGSRVFHISDGSLDNTFATWIHGLTLTGGDVLEGGGGAILSNESITIVECIITNNAAGSFVPNGSGGGIHMLGGELYLVRSSVTDNSATREGGGVYARNAEVRIESSVLSGNTARSGGGVSLPSSHSVISDSLILKNRAINYGGGVMTRGVGATTRVINSTISGNSASGFAGGAIQNYAATTTIEHSTIAGNSSRDGGSIYVSYDARTSTVELSHSIVSGSTNLAGDSVPDFGTNFSSLTRIVADHSLIEAPGTAPIVGENNLFGVDPLLAPLADNGGPTKTHALLPGSPAIDAGDPAAEAGVDGVPEYDQRGAPFVRVADGDAPDDIAIDIGAYERQFGETYHLVVDTLADELDGDYSPGDFSLREAIEIANLNPGADTISFAPSLTAGGPATILLTMGELAITDSLTIDGPGADLLAIDASGNDPTPDVKNGDGSQVFRINDGSASTVIDVEIVGLTLTGGDVAGSGGAIFSSERLSLMDLKILRNAATGSGGGLWASVGATIDGSEFSENSSLNEGGAIYIGGTSTIARTAIRDNQASRDGGGIRVFSGSVVNIHESTISGNTSGRNGGGLYSIRLATTSIYDSVISDNHAIGSGGGLAVFADTTTIVNTVVAGNTAGANGGGVWARSVVLDIRGSVVSGNSAGTRGGGLYSFAIPFHLSDSTVANNSAGTDGGGITAAAGGAPPVIESTTISGNQANRHGGGIFFVAQIAGIIRHSTITGNTADADGDGDGRAGGVFKYIDFPLTVDHSIIAANVDRSGDSPDLSVISSNGLVVEHSLIGDRTGSGLAEGAPDANGNLIGGPANGVIDPKLGPLAYNGGPVFLDGSRMLTHALLAGSPAIEAGDPAAEAGVDGVPEFDQRGAPFVRVADGDEPDDIAIDIGAYERQFGETYHLVVDTLADELDGDYSTGNFSLREAIAIANLNRGADTISFAEHLTAGGPATILLTMGELAITDALTIHGPGADLLTIDASGNDPTPQQNNGDGTSVLRIDDGDIDAFSEVTLNGLTLAGGDASVGGGIYNVENLHIVNSIVQANSASGFFGSGGGVYNRYGTLTIDHSVIKENHSGFSGGGIYNRDGNLLVTGSIISGNTAVTGLGGGIANQSSHSEVRDSLISGNVADDHGGGIASRGLGFHTRIVNSTLSGNRVLRFGGGAISEYSGTTTIVHSTIAGNQSNDGGSILLVVDNFDTNVVLSNTIVAGSMDLSGQPVADFGEFFSERTVITANFSLLENPGMAPWVGDDNIVGMAAGLGPLAHNGGPVFADGSQMMTHALLADSPAIDAGDPMAVAGIDGVPEFDQRRLPWDRVVGDRIDIGAVEAQMALLPGDFNGDGALNNADLTLLLNHWGMPVPPVPAGWVGIPLTAPAVDNDELTALLNSWGQSLPGGAAAGSTGTDSATLTASALSVPMAGEAVQPSGLVPQGEGREGTAGQASSGTRVARPDFAPASRPRPAARALHAAVPRDDALVAWVAGRRLGSGPIADVEAALRGGIDDETSDLHPDAVDAAFAGLALEL